MSNRVEHRVTDQRLAAMRLAVELEVDRDDFLFRSSAEREVWAELEAEFEDRLASEGRTWFADVA